GSRAISPATLNFWPLVITTTVWSVAPSITWLLVAIHPLSLIRKPVPSDLPGVSILTTPSMISSRLCAERGAAAWMAIGPRGRSSRLPSLSLSSLLPCGLELAGDFAGPTSFWATSLPADIPRTTTSTSTARAKTPPPAPRMIQGNVLFDLRAERRAVTRLVGLGGSIASGTANGAGGGASATGGVAGAMRAGG